MSTQITTQYNLDRPFQNASQINQPYHAQHNITYRNTHPAKTSLSDDRVCKKLTITKSLSVSTIHCFLMRMMISLSVYNIVDKILRPSYVRGCYLTQTMTDRNYINDLALLANKAAQAIIQMYSLKQATGNIASCVINKKELFQLEQYPQWSTYIHVCVCIYIYIRVCMCVCVCVCVCML